MRKVTETLARTAILDETWYKIFVPLLESVLEEVKDFALSEESKGKEDYARGEGQALRYLMEMPELLKSRDAQRAEREEAERKEQDAGRRNPGLRYVPRT